MKRHILSSIIAFLGATSALIAQNDIDALRYSYLGAGGTARAAALGGTLGALGADYSAAAQNPAGLAAFRQSEFAITPVLFVPNTESFVNGNPLGTSDSKFNFNVSNADLLFTHVNDEKHWKTVVFGMGFNRLQNFNSQTFFKAETAGSIGDHFAALANGQTTDNLDYYHEGLAYNTYLIDTVGGATSYQSALFNPNALVKKEQSIRTSGGYDEIAISLAGNYENRINIGATLGIPIINYTENKSYSESTVNDANLRSANFNEYLNTNGSGINLKLGATVKISQVVRFGFAVHTPSYLSLTDSFNTNVGASTVWGPQNGVWTDSSKNGLYRYSIITPTRLIGSLSLISKKGNWSGHTVSGFLNLDGEYINYATMRVIYDKNSSSADKATEQAVNQTIKNKYQNAVNLRVGGEFAYDVFRLRAGYALLGNPYKSGVQKTNGAGQEYSIGVGLREKHFSLDLAYTRSQHKDEYTPYLTSLPSALSVIRNMDDDRVMLTIGFKF
ncbi:MAG: hypothetical protein RI894_2029 [Bacteroidota bacterium]|jgi:hypothetical protein